MSTVYKVGTATVTNGSVTVIGDDTSWQLSAVVGGVFVMDGYSAVIESVESDTELTLAEPWEKSTASGNYVIARMGDGLFIVDLYDRITQALLTLSLANVQPDELGTI